MWVAGRGPGASLRWGRGVGREWTRGSDEPVPVPLEALTVLHVQPGQDTTAPAPRDAVQPTHEQGEA